MCPTNSGKIVEVRDQVLSMRFCLVSFISSTRSISLGSTYGPFLLDRLISAPSLSCATATMSLVDAFFLLRVRKPSVGLPHGVTGCEPLFLPSPPPCGWSTGFMTVPRTVGRLPFHRDRPALPPDSFSCVTLPSWPIVARHVAWTRRISPDGSRSSAMPPSLATSCAEPPAERTILPPWPGRSSTLCTVVPVGIDDSGSALPGRMSASAPDSTVAPTFSRSGARM